jgi:hypothetical protein
LTAPHLTSRPPLAESLLQQALLEKQQALSRQIGDAVFMRVIVAYDGLFIVELATVDRDDGYHESFDLDEAFDLASQVLLGMRAARIAYAEGRVLPTFRPPPP